MQRTYQLRLDGATRIPEAVRDRLIAAGRRRLLADGEALFTQGDAADGFGVVISGGLRITRYGEDGGNTVFGVYGPGDLFGEQAFLTSTPRTAAGEGEGPTEVAWIGESVFRRLLAEDSELTLLLLRSLAEKLKYLIHMVDHARRLSVTDRLAIALQSFHCGADGVVEATHQELADMVGVSRVSLGSALGVLVQRGAIERNYGHVRILDRDALSPRSPGLRAVA